MARSRPAVAGQAGRLGEAGQDVTPVRRRAIRVLPAQPLDEVAERAPGRRFGFAAGQQYASVLCSDVIPAAVLDGLIDNPNADNKCPKEGHLVALVSAPPPGWHDYHWYRKGRNGRWTHKPGPGAATNLDNSANLISDPRTADRGLYVDFCTFMTVMHGHTKIR